LDKLIAAIRRWGATQQLFDSVPLDLWKKALRKLKRMNSR